MSQKLKKCKACEQQIAKSAKICPHCGAKNKKKLPFLFILVLIIIIVATLCSRKDTNNATENKETIPLSSMIVEKDDLEESPVETTEVIAEETTEELTEGTTESTTEEIVEDESKSDTLVDGMRPEFKEAMDAYEAFYDEYCEFMKKYNKNPSDMTLLLKYSELLIKAEEMNEAFEEWDEEEMNNAELKYYLEINNRVMQKLLEVTG